MNMRKTLLWNPPAAEAAAEPQSSGSYTRNGTFHIDQFYDIHAEVRQRQGFVTGDHFGGTY